MPLKRGCASGSNTATRSKASSNGSSNRAGGSSSNSSSSRNNRSSSDGGALGTLTGKAPADTLTAVGSVAESISLLAGMSLPDESCRSYVDTPAQNPFWHLLSIAQPQLQYALYLHHSTTSQAYTTWQQHFVRLASALEVHVRVSASSNSPLQSFKQALTAGSCLLNPQHPAQLRPGKWIGTVAMDAALQAGPGSREEQQLFSLACSLLKACSIRLMGGQLEPAEQQEIETHMMAIGTMACSLIMQATMLLKGQGADSGMSSGGTLCSWQLQQSAAPPRLVLAWSLEKSAAAAAAAALSVAALSVAAVAWSAALSAAAAPQETRAGVLCWWCLGWCCWAASACAGAPMHSQLVSGAHQRLAQHRRLLRTSCC